MDPEHLDHYKTAENMREGYRQFITNIPFYGFAVLCTDHPAVQALVPQITDRKIITYGFNPQADVRAENIRMGKNGSTFDVIFREDDMTLCDVFLPMPGQHNVQNSLVALAVAQKLGVPAALLKKGMEKFTGVKRRFTKTGEANGITVIDDYAHHPVEIQAVLKTARTVVNETGGRIIAIMQPHRYSRLNDLFAEFCTAFNEADSVIIADVYEAGEFPIENRNKETLAEGIRQYGHRDVQILPDPKKLARMVAEKSQPGDYVICMGAGDITSWAYDLPDQLAKLTKSNAA